MIRTGTLEQARAARHYHILPNGTGYWCNGLITSPVGDAIAPQAFLVEQDPGTVIESHFHEEDEFQIVVAGSGSLGRHPVEPIRVHYAGAHTGYGPITSGREGLSYFTLRTRMDPGARFLPGARDKMRKGPRRHLLGQPVRSVESTASLGKTALIELWEPQADGIGAWLLRIPPGQAAAAPVHGGGARYLLVTGGVLLLQGEPLPRFAAAFVAGEPAELHAGAEGLEVLVLQFPLPEEENK